MSVYEIEDTGSNPVECTIIMVLWCNWIAHMPSKLRVGVRIPLGLQIKIEGWSNGISTHC